MCFDCIIFIRSGLFNQITTLSKNIFHKLCYRMSLFLSSCKISGFSAKIGTIIYAILQVFLLLTLSYSLFPINFLNSLYMCVCVCVREHFDMNFRFAGCDYWHWRSRDR